MIPSGYPLDFLQFFNGVKIKLLKRITKIEEIKPSERLW